MESPANAAEAYRSAEIRLRTLLLGDGSETIGLAHRDDQRTRVIASLRHMRDAFDALAAERDEVERQDAARVEEADARIAQLEGDLLRLAAERARAQSPEPLLTAAEAARELGLSTSTLYRAVRRGEIAAVRAEGEPMRIPTGEVRRLAPESAPTG